MIDFMVNRQTCTHCGECVIDCPARIISLGEDGYPTIAPEKEGTCYRCQHCLAICPTGSVSILGQHASGSRPLKGAFPDPDALETLIRGRRSVRRFKPENLDPVLFQKLLDVAWQAPTGVNSRQVRFTVLDSHEKVVHLRDEVMAGLSRLVNNNALPERMGYFANFVSIWEKHRVDIIFRDAPHLLIASAPQHLASPMQDCMIALASFDLFAQANGVGTLWNGLAKWAMNDILPETRRRLGIPDDHLFGYAMVFGKPAVHYARTVEHGPALVYRAMEGGVSEAQC
ncbi:MAG: nitroreductase family protein [Chlorobium sp.]|nr:nitroreductase family protein [Chlorobium sp.]